MRRIGGNRAGAARATSAVLLAALLVGGVVAGVAAAAATAGSATAETGDAGGTDAPRSSSTTEGSALAQEIDADRTRIRIALQPDGDGRWTVELWTRLEDDADEEAFASLEADVRNDSASFTTDFRERMNGSVVAASDATGREMTMENVTVSTRTEGVPSSYGVLAYEFEWTSFAAVDGDRLRAGDAIDGFLLEENTRLTIGWPEGYRPTDVEPAPDDETDAAVVWQGGETDFVTGQPRVTVTSAPAEEDSLLPVIAVVVAVLAVLLALAWLVRSGRLDLPAALGGSAAPADGEAPVAGDGTAASSGSVGAPSGAGGAAAATDRDDDTGGAFAPGDSTNGAGDAAGGDDDRSDADGDDEIGDLGDGGDQGADGDQGDGDQADDDVPPELLSNEEQVLRLLEDHGGRIKQQQVVSELDWTEAKTSQVVTGMREEEQIEVFRIGRENVLALPGEADL
jgi:hypothetical protein